MNDLASVGPNLPLEVLHASGRYAGPLGWNIDRDFPRASQWLESKFPRWAFSILEDWADGRFDALKQVVFSRGDDSAQRLYYYICELQRQGVVRGPEAFIFDLAKIPRATSLARTEVATRALAGRLGVDEAALAARQAPVGASQAASATKTCLLAGSAPPDSRIHDMVRRAGWQAAGQTLAELWTASESDEVSFAAVAKRVHDAQAGPRDFRDRAAEIAGRARDQHALAALIWYAEEDEAEIWHLPEQRRALEALGVPSLVLLRRDWRANDGLEDELAAFLAGVSS